MRMLFNTILVVLVLLAVSSGITKIMQLPQDADFFRQYGFSHTILFVYGISQLIGGVLLAIPKTRVAGAIVVGVTFLISAVVLITAGKIPFAVITLIFILLLAFVIKKSLQTSDIQLDK